VKQEARILLLLGLFFGVMCAVYWLWGHEDAGAVMMFFGMLMGFLPGLYYLYWSRRMKPRAEDRSDATVADGEGVIGTFPGSSIFPFTLGMGAFSCVLAMVFGIWLAIPGIGLVFWALIGATAESRHGGEH
jgi:F0F1-type ATP synthase assembly protein I